MSFIRAANPIWWIPDLTGLSLNDEYYAFFKTNDLPYIPQAVYQTPNGNAWENPLQFQPSGTLPNNLYFDPSLTYRIEIRHGNHSSDALIRLIENFSPGGESGVTPINTPFVDAENMITNPQFADVYFVTPFNYAQNVFGNYSISIAPGWRIDLQGTGTLELSQLAFPSPPISGDPNYYLQIVNNGWTQIKLVQRFTNNAFIFDNGAIAVAFTAQSTGSPQPLTVSYVPSSGTGQPVLLDQQIAVGAFNNYGSAVTLDAVTGTGSAPTGYVDIVFSLLPNATIDITNIQILGQTEPLSGTITAPLYRQQTYERTVDHEFNVYKNSLLIEPKENLLTGWNFGLNPWQFITTTSTLVTSFTQYIADQTMLHQQTASSFFSGKGDATNNFGLVLKANNAIGSGANRIAIFQYIDYKTVCPFFGQIVSCFVRAALLSPTSTTTKLKMRLIYRTDGSVITRIGDAEPITGWDSNDDPLFASPWEAIEPLNDVNYKLPVFTTTPINNFPGMAYNQFQLPVAPSATPYLGVVIYTTSPVNNTIGFEDSIIFDRVSMIVNDFGMDAAPETFDESLRKCQAYYEKSYDFSTLPGSFPNRTGSSTVASLGASAKLYGIERPFKVEKISVPTMTWYSPITGASNVVHDADTETGGANDKSLAVGNNYVNTKSTGVPILGVVFAGNLEAQWTANSMLGR